MIEENNYGFISSYNDYMKFLANKFPCINWHFDLFYYDNGGFRTNDGSEVVTIDPTFTRNQILKVAVKWGYLLSNVAKRSIGYSAIGGAITFASDGGFDGAHTLTTVLQLLTNNNDAPVWFIKILIFNRVLSNDEINEL